MVKQRNSKNLLTDYHQTITNMLEKRANAKQQIKDETEKLEKELEEAKENISESVISGNGDAFKQWSDQRNFCELRIKYLKEQEALLPKKTATEAESNDFARKVILLARKADADNKKRAKELISELQMLMDDSEELRQFANYILARWNEHIGDITVAKEGSGEYFTSELATLKRDIERIDAYKKIRDGIDRI